MLNEIKQLLESKGPVRKYIESIHDGKRCIQVPSKYDRYGNVIEYKFIPILKTCTSTI